MQPSFYPLVGRGLLYYPHIAQLVTRGITALIPNNAAILAEEDNKYRAFNDNSGEGDSGDNNSGDNDNGGDSDDSDSITLVIVTTDLRISEQGLTKSSILGLLLLN
ncbi:uncharacterized protein K441DRAFT_683241 [Cenococcum geophilum 1.58]|uniref:Uncharacterized protein n=1 Tax=Cenococcum geophilum 1.58 TaxID=794803 RepID=A0ACC8EK24_9PEZI|nr:hypothetical protein K441DRAFT_683241 [Cenococcum geophilum 1.58]